MFAFHSRLITYSFLVSIKMTDSGKVTLEEASRAMPLNDGQGCWHDVFSPTRVLTAEEKLDHNMNQQQQQQQVEKDTMMMEMGKKKTKKCRGNRKEQQRRRKLRRQEEKKAKKQNNEEPMNGMDQDMAVSDDRQHERVQVSCHLCRDEVVVIDD